MAPSISSSEEKFRILTGAGRRVSPPATPLSAYAPHLPPPRLQKPAGLSLLLRCARLKVIEGREGNEQERKRGVWWWQSMITVALESTRVRTEDSPC